MRTYASIGIAVPEVLIPREGINLRQWAVVACDQYTSEPEYWRSVEERVGEDPSTLRLVYPEVHLEDESDDEGARIASIQAHMRAYLEQNLLQSREGMVFVERRVGDRTREGIVVCVDLEAYDYSKGSASLIRATEGTIVERLPPRVKVRQGALLESPHIMVLIDDPEDGLMGPLRAARAGFEALYDFELMKGGGHLSGYLVDEPRERGVVAALEALVNPETFRARYGLTSDAPVLLHAMGDGNHSLATAKSIWERFKADSDDLASALESPLRYALVELVNLHNEALEFEPIHRVLFELNTDFSAALAERFGARLATVEVDSMAALMARVDAPTSGVHRVGLIEGSRFMCLEVSAPRANLAVGTLQNFLDDFMREDGAKSIDYVHGSDVVERLGSAAGNVGLYLPGMSKAELFPTVILDGALPRKTFSMGEAHEKRFYMECRRIG